MPAYQLPRVLIDADIWFDASVQIARAVEDSYILWSGTLTKTRLHRFQPLSPPKSEEEICFLYGLASGHAGHVQFFESRWLAWERNARRSKTNWRGQNVYNLINSTLIEDDYFKHDRFIVTPTTSIKDYNDHI